MIKPIIRPAKILIVGEAPGKNEDITGTPFVGASGFLLAEMLADAGLAPRPSRGTISMMNWWKDSPFAVTNVFLERPPNNKIEAFCAGKKEVGGTAYTLPPLRQGKYVRPEYLHNLNRLRDEIEEVRPNLILALGATACWALLRKTKISTIRGTLAESIFGPKTLPAYHPAAILRNWEYRTITVADFMKAAREQDSPDLIRPRRELWVEPTLADLARFQPYIDEAPYLSIDIETAKGQILCVGIATSPDRALILPFVDRRKPNYSYWPDLNTEVQAWKWLRRVLESPKPKGGQNFLYDIQWLWTKAGIAPRNITFDTMLKHHALQPELPKSLGFLASVYTNEPEWKAMRKEEKANG